MVDGAIGLFVLLNGRPLRGYVCWPHYSPGGVGDDDGGGGERVNVVVVVLVMIMVVLR